MDFSGAVLDLKAGKKVSRVGWNGKGMFIKAQFPDEGSQNTLPYVWMRTAQGGRVPWLCSQTDLFAEDWFELLPDTIG